MLKILQYGSPILEKPTKKVDDLKDLKLKTLIEGMLEVLDKEEDHSAGLSAPQVGQGIRVAICRRMDLEEVILKKNEAEAVQTGKKPRKVKAIWEIMINPEITFKSKETSTKWEGCLSVNEGDLFGQVTRPKTVKVKYSNLNGEELEITADEYFSHVVQHELDHLEGILFLKYITDPSQLHSGDELEDA